MPVSESEKIGVPILGCRFSGMAEHVPIKKRRFLFRAPSPPPRDPSPHPQETDKPLNNECQVGQVSHSDSITKCEVVANNVTSANDGGWISETKIDVGVKNMGKVHEQIHANEDFSGMSILSAAACRNSLGGDDDPAQAGSASGVEESSADQVSHEVIINTESCCSMKRLSEEDFISSDEILTKRISYSISMATAGEPTSSLGADSSSQKFPHENNIEDTCLQDNSGDVAQDCLSKDDQTVNADEISSRGDRLHWDLNTVMEAWEHPVDNQVVVPQTNVANGILQDAKDGGDSDNRGNPAGDDLRSDVKDKKFDIGKAQLPTISSESAQGTLELRMHISDACNATEEAICLKEKLLSSETDTSPNKDLINELKSLDYHGREASLPLVALPEDTTCEFGEDLIENSGNADGISGLHNEQNISNNLSCMKTIQPPSGTGCLDYVAEGAVNKTLHLSGRCDNNQISVAEDIHVHHSEASAHNDTETAAQANIDTEETTIKASQKFTALLGESCPLISYDDAQGIYSDDLVDNSGKVAPGQPLKDNYNSSELKVDYDSQYEDGELRESIEHTWEESDAEDGEAEHVDYGSDERDTDCFGATDHHASMLIKVEGTGYKNQRSSDSNTLCSEAGLDIKNVREIDFQSCQKGLSTSKIEVEVAQSCKGTAVKSSEPCARPQVSPKDAIKESDINDKVDKEFFAGSDKFGIDNEIHGRGDEVKDSDQSEKTSQDLFPENHSSSSDIATGSGDYTDRENRAGDFMDGFNAKNAEAQSFGSREIRREMQSRVKGPGNLGMFLRKDRLQGSSDGHDSNSRYGKGRNTQHIYTRRQGDHFVDYLEDHGRLRRNLSPSFQDPAGFPCLTLDNVASAVSDDVKNNRFITSNGFSEKPVGDGPTEDVGRQTANPSSPGVDYSLKRSELADMHKDMGSGLVEEKIPRGSMPVSRGRYMRSDRVNDRSPRGRCHGTVSDDCEESSSKYSHHLTRRERSISPFERRRNPHARRSSSKSLSRSRTRSPNAWQSPIGRHGNGFARNPCLRDCSRSPNFRSRGRMLRRRSPHQQTDFVAGRMMGFMSTPRRHGSPLRNTRWIGDRKEGIVHFREQDYKQRSSVFDRRSPGRNFTRGHRFDFADSHHKLKLNDYSRSMHPGRFSRTDEVGREGSRFEGRNDGRRNGYQYGLVHPLRRFDTDRDLKRFNCDTEDGFVAEHKSGHKGTTGFHGRGNLKDYGRDIGNQIDAIPRRRYREERDSFPCRRDGNSNANPKPFGMREFDDDASPKGRPS